MISQYSEFTQWALDDARTLDERYLIYHICEVTRRIDFWLKPLEYQRKHPFRMTSCQEWKLFQLNPLLVPEYSTADTELAMAMMPNFKEFKPYMSMHMRQFGEVSSVLRFFPALELISLGWTSLQDVSFVEALPNLHTLQVSSGELEDLGPFRKCASLRHLTLQLGHTGPAHYTPHYTPPLYWVDASPLGALSQLESLTFSPNPALLEGLNFPLLHKAEFSGGACIQADCRHLPNMPALRLLAMDHVQSLRGIGRFPRLWHLKVAGPLRDFVDVEMLQELNCLEVDTQLGWPRKVTPLAELPELLWARFTGEVPRNYWPMAAAPKLCQLEVLKSATVQLEVQAINATLTPWDTIFALPEPRPLPPLRFVSVELGGDRSILPHEPQEPGADFLAHPKMFHLELCWMYHRVVAAIRRVAGQDAVEKPITIPSELHFSRGLVMYLSTLEAVTRLPEVLDAIRGELAWSAKEWRVQVISDLKITEREMSDQEKRWLKQVEEHGKRMRDAWDDDETEHQRFVETRQHLMDTQFRLRVSEEEGEEPDPEEFEPSELIRPEAPRSYAQVISTRDIQPASEDDEEEEEDPEFELKPFDEQEQNTPDENNADDGSAAVKLDPNPPEDFWEDPYAHPLASYYRFYASLTFTGFYHHGNNLATLIQMMRRHPDEFHPAPPKTEE